jgi:hypothetical protein
MQHDGAELDGFGTSSEDEKNSRLGQFLSVTSAFLAANCILIEVPNESSMLAGNCRCI